MNSKQFKNIIIPLAEKVYPMIVRMLGSRENAEDALQEIMIKLWKKRNEIGRHPNIQALIFTTARNYCIDILRKNQPEIESLHIHISENNTNELEWEEMNMIIRNLLKELPEKQAEVLLLRDIDGLEYHEIADLTSNNIESIRVLLSRARKKIREKLQTIYSYEYKEK